MLPSAVTRRGGSGRAEEPQQGWWGLRRTKICRGKGTLAAVATQAAQTNRRVCHPDGWERTLEFVLCGNLPVLCWCGSVQCSGKRECTAAKGPVETWPLV